MRWVCNTRTSKKDKEKQHPTKHWDSGVGRPKREGSSFARVIEAQEYRSHSATFHVVLHRAGWKVEQPVFELYSSIWCQHRNWYLEYWCQTRLCNPSYITYLVIFVSVWRIKIAYRKLIILKIARKLWWVKMKKIAIILWFSRPYRKGWANITLLCAF